jgi:hypothetical protein
MNDTYEAELQEIVKFVQHFMDICRELETLLDQTWRSFILGNSQDGMGELANVFDDLQQIFSQADLLNDLQFVEINNGDIVKKLGELENAMVIPDYILTADIIKYEIKPIIVAWRKNVWTKMKKLNVKMN